MPWARVLHRTVKQDPSGDHYILELDCVRVASGARSVLALLSARDDTGGTTTMPSGWSSVVRYFPTDPGTGSDIGLLLAKGPRTDQSVTFTHGSSFCELVGAEMLNVDIANAGTPVTDLDPGGTTAMSIDVSATGAGIVMVAIRVNNADSGTTWTSKPSGWVSIYERTITGGSGERDWGAVLWGYKPVTAAGTYTMSFTMGGTFADWYKVLVGVWIPTTGDPSVVQTATSGEVFSGFPSMTFPDPL